MTRVYSETGRVLLAMYKHLDGYPTGIGDDLKRFLMDMKRVNRPPQEGDDGEEEYSSMDMLAGKLYFFFQAEYSDVYQHQPDAADQEWTYNIYPDGDGLRLEVKNSFTHNTYHNGTLDNFNPMQVEEMYHGDEVDENA